MPRSLRRLTPRRHQEPEVVTDLLLADYLNAEADRYDAMAEKYHADHDAEVAKSGGSTYGTCRGRAIRLRTNALAAGDRLASPSQSDLYNLRRRGR